MLDFIAEDGFCPQRPVERKPLADSMDTQRYDDNRISFESVQQMRGKGSRDYLSEYDLLTSQKKCMYVMETYNDGSRY